MSLEENIDIVKWCFFETETSLDIKKYTLKCFPELKEINKNLSKQDIFKQIENVVAKNYIKIEENILEEVKRYNKIWYKYNDLYMEQISKYLNIKWPLNIKTIDVGVGLIPVFPRYLDKFSFSILIGLEQDKVILVCAHEVLHFIWFEKWKQIYPEHPKYMYDSPYIPWKYSEIVTDPILNSDEIFSILKVKEKSYDYFYKLKDEGNSVMDTLKKIYKSNKSIEDKIKIGYEYFCDFINKK